MFLNPEKTSLVSWFDEQSRKKVWQEISADNAEWELFMEKKKPEVALKRMGIHYRKLNQGIDDQVKLENISQRIFSCAYEEQKEASITARLILEVGTDKISGAVQAYLSLQITDRLIHFDEQGFVRVRTAWGLSGSWSYWDVPLSSNNEQLRFKVGLVRSSKETRQEVCKIVQNYNMLTEPGHQKSNEFIKDICDALNVLDMSEVISKFCNPILKKLSKKDKLAFDEKGIPVLPREFLGENGECLKYFSEDDNEEKLCSFNTHTELDNFLLNNKNDLGALFLNTGRNKEYVDFVNVDIPKYALKGFCRAFVNEDDRGNRCLNGNMTQTYARFNDEGSQEMEKFYNKITKGATFRKGTDRSELDGDARVLFLKPDGQILSTLTFLWQFEESSDLACYDIFDKIYASAGTGALIAFCIVHLKLRVSAIMDMFISETRKIGELDTVATEAWPLERIVEGIIEDMPLSLESYPEIVAVGSGNNEPLLFRNFEPKDGAVPGEKDAWVKSSVNELFATGENDDFYSIAVNDLANELGDRKVEFLIGCASDEMDEEVRDTMDSLMMESSAEIWGVNVDGDAKIIEGVQQNSVNDKLLCIITAVVKVIWEKSPSWRLMMDKINSEGVDSAFDESDEYFENDNNFSP